MYYVGKGCRTRYYHVNSGMSSSYKLNEFHFSGKTMDIFLVKEGLTEEEALALEQTTIVELAPVYNSVLHKGFVHTGVKTSFTKPEEGCYALDVRLSLTSKKIGTTMMLVAKNFNTDGPGIKPWCKVIISNLTVDRRVYFKTGDNYQPYDNTCKKALMCHHLMKAIKILERDGLITVTMIRRNKETGRMPSYFERTAKLERLLDLPLNTTNNIN